MTRWTPAQVARQDKASRKLAVELSHKPGSVFTLKGRGKDHKDRRYQMLVLPDGTPIHTGEAICEDEFFRGPGHCWHSKEGNYMTIALTRYEEQFSPVAIDFNEEQLAVIKSTIAKGSTTEELQLFVATCRRTGLDPFLHQIYAIKRWDARAKREVMAIQVGIDGLRLVAERTGKYAGQDPIEWLDANGQWAEVWTGVGDYPVAARTAVYRKDFRRKVPAVARWDSYAQFFGNPPKLGPTWEKMPDVMLGKCAESLALRRAFPADTSGLAAALNSDYDPEADQAELEGSARIEEWTDIHQPAEAVIDATPKPVQAPPRPPRPAPPMPDPEPEAQPEAQPACDHDPVFDDATGTAVCSKCGLDLKKAPQQPPLGKGIAPGQRYH